MAKATSRRHLAWRTLIFYIFINISPVLGRQQQGQVIPACCHLVLFPKYPFFGPLVGPCAGAALLLSSPGYHRSLPFPWLFFELFLQFGLRQVDPNASSRPAGARAGCCHPAPPCCVQPGPRTFSPLFPISLANICPVPEEAELFHDITPQNTQPQPPGFLHPRGLEFLLTLVPSPDPAAPPRLGWVAEGQGCWMFLLHPRLKPSQLDKRLRGPALSIGGAGELTAPLAPTQTTTSTQGGCPSKELLLSRRCTRRDGTSPPSPSLSPRKKSPASYQKKNKN